MLAVLFDVLPNSGVDTLGALGAVPTTPPSDVTTTGPGACWAKRSWTPHAASTSRSTGSTPRAKRARRMLARRISVLVVAAGTAALPNVDTMLSPGVAGVNIYPCIAIVLQYVTTQSNRSCVRHLHQLQVLARLR